VPTCANSGSKFRVRLGQDLPTTTLLTGEDNLVRCGWCGDDPEYVRYHDSEWGRPVVADQLLFEKICLEGFQSGLSWLTILRKRAAFRRAFENFDPVRVAEFDSKDVDRLMQDAGIVRHRGKIEAVIQNARSTLVVQSKLGSLRGLVWSFCDEIKLGGGWSAPQRTTDIKARTPQSEALSKALRGFGFKFVGPTTMYAAMQSLGLVNDHFEGCHVRQDCQNEREIALTKMRA